MDVSGGVAWLLLVFSLPARQASRRVEVWRKLRRYGALPLRSSGYLLPATGENHERFQWLAAAVRKYKGEASVVQVSNIDDLPSPRLVQLFLEARAGDYQALLRELQKQTGASRPSAAQLTRWRRRFHEITAIDFFHSPLRSRVESLLERLETGAPAAVPTGGKRMRKEYRGRTWITRPRPGIDRVSSAWLIRRFIDPQAKFAFLGARQAAGAIPFDTFLAEGSGHRGDDCTFETLRKEFTIRDAKVAAIAEIIHDADLGDEKFARPEGAGLDRVLIGWAQQGMPDDELLRRGMDLIEALYHALPEAAH